METKKKEQNTKAEAETFAATVKGMNRDDQLKQKLRRYCATTNTIRRKNSEAVQGYLQRVCLR